MPAVAVTLAGRSHRTGADGVPREQADNYQRPVSIKVVDQLPRTPSLKMEAGRWCARSTSAAQVRRTNRRRVTSSGEDQRPWNSALRGPSSTKLRRPRWPSSDAKHRVIPMSLAFRARDRLRPAGSSAKAFERPASRTAVPAGNCRAQPSPAAMAASSTSASSSTRSASPIAWASSAPTVRPVRIRSFARAGPTTRGRRWCAPGSPA